MPRPASVSDEEQLHVDDRNANPERGASSVQGREVGVKCLYSPNDSEGAVRNVHPSVAMMRDVHIVSLDDCLKILSVEPMRSSYHPRSECLIALSCNGLEPAPLERWRRLWTDKGRGSCKGDSAGAYRRDNERTERRK